MFERFGKRLLADADGRGGRVGADLEGGMRAGTVWAWLGGDAVGGVVLVVGSG